jgi:hypothetical protein
MNSRGAQDERRGKKTKNPFHDAVSIARNATGFNARDKRQMTVTCRIRYFIASCAGT